MADPKTPIWQIAEEAMSWGDRIREVSDEGGEIVIVVDYPSDYFDDEEKLRVAFGAERAEVKMLEPGCESCGWGTTFEITVHGPTVPR